MHTHMLVRMCECFFHSTYQLFIMVHFTVGIEKHIRTIHPSIEYTYRDTVTKAQIWEICFFLLLFSFLIRIKVTRFLTRIFLVYSFDSPRIRFLCIFKSRLLFTIAALSQSLSSFFCF